MTEATAAKNTWMKMLKDAKDMWSTGKMDIDALHKKGLHDEDLLPPSISNYVGRIHGILKIPAKRFVYEHSFERRMAWNIDHTKGFNPSDATEQFRISTEAYKDANRAIFLADNKVSDFVRDSLARLDTVDRKTGHADGTGKALATVGHVLLPIVKVPTNIAAETFNYAMGHVIAGGKMGLAGLEGYKNLSASEKSLPVHEKVAGPWVSS